MKNFLKYSLIALLPLLFATCIEIEEFDNSPQGNFEALWKIMDEHYCFFDVKGVDWDAVHAEYAPKITPKMSRDTLFLVLSAMLREVRDGHVNLISAFNLGRYWDWYENYPKNFNQELIDAYLGHDYQIAAGLRYKILEPDSIGYVRYADFMDAIGEANLDYVIYTFRNCRGMIVDVRDNGGGVLDYAEMLASRFVSKKTLVGYMQHKTGKGHNDFSKPVPKYIEPPADRWRYLRDVVVLTNRHCYSATNDFVNAMSGLPGVTILGDTTGGGSGLPFSSEIPNGWGVRFSACPMYNADMQDIEGGIAPDTVVSLVSSDARRKRDTLIEAARERLRRK
ncbi:peptidase, S41 family [Candidatus Symbiothrix dinenymphae]|nr:peptidase, S41 family [Candidatus Symbiothrix dinenymphae]